MKFRILAAAAALVLSASIQAETDPLDQLAEACATDKEKYCNQVTPGDPRRMLACAYAHEDKLSGQCSWALYQAANAVQQFAAALEHLATQCEADIESLCSSVRLGDGRVLTCLMDRSEAVSAGCNQAIADTVEVD